jgi:competence protein ComK
MIIKNYNLIDSSLILMTGEYDQNGKLCARIMIGEKSLLVDRTPVQLLDDTLTYIGFDLRGAIAGAKSILGTRHMCPIMVNPYQGLCLFPNKSPFKEECIWFNPEHIVNTTPIGGKTELELSNGHSIIVDTKLTSFNTKMQRALQLKRLTNERGNQPSSLTFYLEPKKRHQLSREKTGKYNFAAFDTKKGE